MTIDREFNIVTFWETMRNEKFELKGRIKPEEKENLKNFLYNINKENPSEGYLNKFLGFSNFFMYFG